MNYELIPLAGLLLIIAAAVLFPRRKRKRRSSPDKSWPITSSDPVQAASREADDQWAARRAGLTDH